MKDKEVTELDEMKASLTLGGGAGECLVQVRGKWRGCRLLSKVLFFPVFWGHR